MTAQKQYMVVFHNFAECVFYASNRDMFEAWKIYYTCPKKLKEFVQAN